MTRRGLVTGATGYVGGKLVQRLLDDGGWTVRVLTRDADRLPDPWKGRVEAVEGDASDPDTVARAMEEVEVAWFLLHSMGAGDDFAETDRRLATLFADSAKAAGVRRIVYLGGLHPHGEELSEHLASRVEVGEIFQSSGVPTAALQAGVVLGDESASFQMLRHLSERLPGAIGPKWLTNRIQPIAIDDAIHYLAGAAEIPDDVNRTFDIGGPDVLPYADMMKRYAEVKGLAPRVILIAPVTTPRLAARWVGLVTPIPTTLAEPLILSVLHDTVVKERDIDAYVPRPEGGLTGFTYAVRRASEGVDTGRWRRTLARVAAGVVATAVAGSIATKPDSAWYQSIRKPAWQPPGWLFPIVWTALYADIAGISALALADTAERGEDDQHAGYRRALIVNLLLNAGWSFAFFRGKRPPVATVVAVALAGSTADLVRRAGKVSPEKGVVLSPYAAWTAFAAVLSAEIARLNRR